jgi:hypothetical protein
MRTLAALAVLLLVAACQSPPPTEMTQAEIAQIEAEVNEWAEAWVDVWRANDCELSRPLMHPTRMHVLWGGKPHNSIDEWMDYCTSTIANRAGWSGEWTDTEVRVYSGDAAVFIGTYSGTYTYRDETPARHYPVATQVIILERAGDGWGVTSFENSNGPYEEVEAG